MGDALLLQWCRLLELVLQVPLCPTDIRLDILPLSITDMSSFSPLDLKHVDKMTFDFQLGQPFRPFQQLMGVLPAASREHVPQAYQVKLA
jgi:hypothetical protein